MRAAAMANLKAGPKRVEQHRVLKHLGEPAGREADEGQTGLLGVVECQQDEAAPAACRGR
jgi:hypothetical protein